MSNNLEYRSIEFKLDPVQEDKKLRGYAAVFNSLSEDLGGFRERILPGAFKRALSQPNLDILALGFHNPDVVLGRTSAGTLILREDATGLYMEIDIPNTTAAADIAENVRLGNLRQMSIGFMINKESFKEERGLVVREISDLDLVEVSIVTFPAYKATSVNLRELGFGPKETKPQPGYFRSLLKRIFDRKHG